MTPRRSRKSRYKSSAYTSSRGEITPTTRNDLYRPCIKNLYLRRDESRLAIIGEGRAMENLNVELFGCSVISSSLSLCLSPSPSTPPGRLDRSVFHVTQLPRRKYHPYIFAKSWTRSFVPSFRIYLPNISFSLPSFFLSFFFFFRCFVRNIEI